MDTLEQFFRFAGISQLVLLAIVLIKDHRDKISALLIAAWALSGASYLTVVPAFRDWHWGTMSHLFLVGSLAWPVLFWLVAKALFQDGFRLRLHHIVVLVLVIGVGVAGDASAFKSGFGATLHDFSDIVVTQTIALILVIMALVVVWKDWRDDLVESRRRLRFVLLVATGFFGLISGAAVFIVVNMPAIIEIRMLDTIHVGIVFLLSLGASVGFYSVHSQFIATSGSQLSALVSPPEDFTQTIAQLNQIMHEEHVYCEHGLTIGSLAELLNQKEYKLRRVINIEFGYRNFNDFLNQHRITEAARRLIAPDTKNLPVLTIAIDVGYSSLGPFYRAFKDLLHMTPTQYRATAAVEATAAFVSDKCAERSGDDQPQ